MGKKNWNRACELASKRENPEFNHGSLISLLFVLLVES